MCIRDRESSGKTTVALHAVAQAQKEGGIAAFIDAEHALDVYKRQPYIFEFPTDDLIRLQQRKHLLEEVGVYLEEYGANQLILREHPIWMKEEEIESGIYEMCDMLLLTKEVSIKKYRAELAIMMSCKRSIKANHTLDDYSARDLIYQLSQCDNPYNCPHGRPVLVNFTKSDMEKMFRRIQENHTSLRELGKY